MARRRTEVLVITALLLVAACSNGQGTSLTDGSAGESAEGDAAPAADIRYIVPSSGGAIENAARVLQPFWEERLGVNAVIDQQPGGQMAIGTQALVQSGAACDAVLHITPTAAVYSYYTQDVDYTADDLAPLGAVLHQRSVVLVSNESSYATFDDLVEDIESRPGEVRASVASLTNDNYLSLVEIQDKLDLDYNIVAYEGGSEARAAVLSGEVEFTVGPLSAALSLADETRTLAVHWDERVDAIEDVPTLDELTGQDFVPNSSLHMLFATSACREENPEQFQFLVDTLSEAANDPGYLEQLEAQGDGHGFLVMGQEEGEEWLATTVETIDAIEAGGGG